MAYYNPNRVEFNPNTMTIQAVGSVGRSLWDIYKHNVEKNQTQAKLDETNRSNLASEAQAAANLAETARSHYASEKQRADELDQKKIFNNAQINHWGNQDKISGFNADTSRMNANTAVANLGLNQNKFAYQRNLDAMKMGGDELQNDMILGTLGVNLPDEVKALPPQQQSKYKQALVNTLTNDKVNKALALQGKALNANGEITLKKKQPTQAERNSITSLIALSELLTGAKTRFTGGEQGAVQNATHGVANFFGIQNPDTQFFKDTLRMAQQQAKDMLGSGKISNMQYYDLLRALPDPNAWSDSGYRTNNDATMNNLLNILTTKIQTLRDSGIDTSELEESLVPTYKNIFENGYFDNKFRAFDANGRRLRQEQNNQAPQNSGFVPKGVDNNTTNTNQNVIQQKASNGMTINFR